jgi:thioesterase domain-containing protein/acyl carrier protein
LKAQAEPFRRRFRALRANCLADARLLEFLFEVETGTLADINMQELSPLGEEKAAPQLRRADLALSTKWKEPETEAEAKLAKIWQDVLGIDTVGVADDFFELGGDSFAATTLAAEIEATFRTRFTPGDILTSPTVAQQAKALVAGASGAATALPSYMILGKAGGPKSPVFMVHGGKGFAFFRPIFLDIVGEERSVYLYQVPGLNGRMRTPDTVEEIATLYVEGMRGVQPEGPYNLVAMCGGSIIALEMCHQLNEAGQAVSRLILLDPPAVEPGKTPRKKKNKRKRLSLRRLAAQLVGFVRGEKREAANQEEAFAIPPQRLERKRQNVQRRVEQMKDIAPEERTDAAERMFKVTQHLRKALLSAERRSFPGSVAMVVNSSMASEVLAETGFWPNHLGPIRHKVIGSKHSEIFNEHLEETARFVRDALN